MVGSPQVINCTATTPIDNVDITTYLNFIWTGPGGGSITNNSRVTISPTTSSGNTYTSNLQFTYLMEGDEGTYTCNVTFVDVTGSNLSQLVLTGTLLFTNVLCTCVYI